MIEIFLFILSYKAVLLGQVLGYFLENEQLISSLVDGFSQNLEQAVVDTDPMSPYAKFRVVPIIRLLVKPPERKKGRFLRNSHFFAKDAEPLSRRFLEPAPLSVEMM